MSEGTQVCLNTDPEFIDGWVPRMAQVLRNRGDADNATLLEVLKERHDSALAELNTRSPAWRDDMENAPRDGAEVLIYDSRTGKVLKGRCDTRMDHLIDEPDRDGWTAEGGAYCQMSPTHWMPLPLPPEEGRG